MIFQLHQITVLEKKNKEPKTYSYLMNKTINISDELVLLLLKYCAYLIH